MPYHENWIFTPKATLSEHDNQMYTYLQRSNIQKKLTGASMPDSVLIYTTKHHFLSLTVTSSMSRKIRRRFSSWNPVSREMTSLCAYGSLVHSNSRKETLNYRPFPYRSVAKLHKISLVDSDVGAPFPNATNCRFSNRVVSRWSLSGPKRSESHSCH